MPRVGHQGRGAAEHAGAELDRDKDQIDDQADGIARVAGVDRAMVMAARTMGVVVVVTGVVMAGPVVCVIMTVRHEEPLGSPRCAVNEAGL